MGVRKSGIAVLTVTALVLAGCGGDDAKESTEKPARTTTTTTEAPTTTEPKGPTAEAQDVAVTLADDSFDLPAELAAGPTRFVATNRGDQAHGMFLVALTDGLTPEALADDAAGALAADQLVPGPQNVAPGASQSTVVDLEAGSYAAVSVVAGPRPFRPPPG